MMGLLGMGTTPQFQGGSSADLTVRRPALESQEMSESHRGGASHESRALRTRACMAVASRRIP
jgi:hypothetical protein